MIKFTLDQVKALCGGEFPRSDAAWERVEYFLFENGALNPYEGEEIIPLPSFRVLIKPILLDEFY